MEHGFAVAAIRTAKKQLTAWWLVTWTTLSFRGSKTCRARRHTLSRMGSGDVNKWLIGNGHWCPTCKGTGRGESRDMIEYSNGTYALFYDLCATCKGERRVAAEVAQVLACTVAPTPRPDPTCFLPIIEYGKLTPTGRLPRRRS
jgi:hypothetical protein